MWAAILISLMIVGMILGIGFMEPRGQEARIAPNILFWGGWLVAIGAAVGLAVAYMFNPW